MNLLFTGSSGFLGKNIIPILSEKYKITTLGLNKDDNICINLSNTVPILTNSYDIILHAAGKAHSIPKTDKEHEDFYKINYQGTVNLCMALEKQILPKSFIFISSVAVYGAEYGEKITENWPLNGSDSYAKSKIMAEDYLTNWCKKYNVILSIIRPSLIAGPNPPGNLNTMINGIKTGRYLSIAGGKAKKSILHVRDIANLVPILSEKGGIYNLCDDYSPSFRDLELIISKQLNKKTPLNIPYWLAKSLALIGNIIGSKSPINTHKLNKISKSLTFSNEKAKRELNWTPTNVMDNFSIF